MPLSEIVSLSSREVSHAHSDFSFKWTHLSVSCWAVGSSLSLVPGYPILRPGIAAGISAYRAGQFPHVPKLAYQG